ncbi:hypothetical protein B0I21_11616 [Sphingobacterium paludis]|uniref:Uncharacterized protein n=1 Tax=Sphingobacterium paludis TaxID=1476465 RepID=A0A4V3E0T9_9SPHI|nr:hypothetical protein B0I21_11616 [Sphingobacterium paludis]
MLQAAIVTKIVEDIKVIIDRNSQKKTLVNFFLFFYYKLNRSAMTIIYILTTKLVPSLSS